MSIQASIDTHMALVFQELTGAEISFDLIFDKKRMSNFPLVTRGGPGVAMSDHLFYFTLSPDYVVIPFFHTHPDLENELGIYMPSLGDLKALYNLTILQEKKHMYDTVLFPDGKAVVYSVGDDGVPFIETRQWNITFSEQ